MKKELITKYKISVASKNRNAAIDLILNRGLRYIKSYIDDEKKLIIFVYKMHLKQFLSLFCDNQIDAEYEEICGFLCFLEDIKYRLGILFGVLILFISLAYSSKVVWKINISGNTSISDEEIINDLEAAGFNLGTFIPNLDYDALHNKILMNNDKLAWISVNIHGNVANVMVKEKYKENTQKQPLYTNVIAKSDGYIASVVVIDGKKQISVGDVVRKGDILISGVFNSQSQGVRYEHAKGEIKAYVNKEINVKIPFNKLEKIYTGNIVKNKEYKIYNFPIFFSTKYRNYSEKYDTIVKKEKLCLLGISQIPFETVTTTYYEYRLEEVTLSMQEAVDLAFVELRQEMDAVLKDCELISKNVTIDYDSDYFYLNCQVYCLEDIAFEQEFFLTE